MTNTRSEPPSAPALRPFQPLEHAAFTRLEHAAYLKGLLKPFKGKGELELWASQCEVLRDQLIALAQRVLAQATVDPFDRLPVMLAQQRTSAGTAYLRWRNVDRTAMGVSLWTQLISDPSTPVALLHELFALEQQRVVLNMQIGLAHSLARQAHECAEKLAQAEVTYQRRVRRHAGIVLKEFAP